MLYTLKVNEDDVIAFLKTKSYTPGKITEFTVQV